MFPNYTKKLNASRNFTAGFTLIELMVVVSIMTLLSSIALSMFISTRVRARVGAAQASLSSLLPAILVCLGSGNGGNTIIQASIGGDVCSDTAATNAKWPALPRGGGWGYSADNFNGNAGSFYVKVTGDARTCILQESGVSGC